MSKLQCIDHMLYPHRERNGVTVVATVDSRRRKIIVDIPPCLSYEVQDHHIVLPPITLKLSGSNENVKEWACAITKVDAIAKSTDGGGDGDSGSKDGSGSGDDGDGDSTGGVCSVCWERKCKYIFLPCGHFTTCLECGPKIYLGRKKCPVCRGVIRDMKEVFYGNQADASK